MAACPPRAPSRERAERRLWSALMEARRPRHWYARVAVGTLARIAGCSRQYAHRCLRRWRRWGAIRVRRTGRASVYLVLATPPWLRYARERHQRDVNSQPPAPPPPHPLYPSYRPSPCLDRICVRRQNESQHTHIPGRTWSPDRRRPGTCARRYASDRWHGLTPHTLADPAALERRLRVIERWVSAVRGLRGRYRAHLAAVYALRYGCDPVALWWSVVRRPPAHLDDPQHSDLRAQAIRRTEAITMTEPAEIVRTVSPDSAVVVRVAEALRPIPAWRDWWSRALGGADPDAAAPAIVRDVAWAALTRIIAWCREHATLRPTGTATVDADTGLRDVAGLDAIAHVPGFGAALVAAGLLDAAGPTVIVRGLVPDHPRLAIVSRTEPDPIPHVRLLPTQVAPIYQAYPAHRRGSLGAFARALETGAWAVLAARGDPDPGATLLEITRRYASSWAATHDGGIAAIGPQRFFAADGDWTRDPRDWDQPGSTDAAFAERIRRAVRERDEARRAEAERRRQAWAAFMRAQGIPPTPPETRHDGH